MARALEPMQRHQSGRVLRITRPNKRCSTWAEITTVGYTGKRIEGQAGIVKDSSLTQKPGGEESLPASLWTGLESRRRLMRRHWRNSAQGFRTAGRAISFVWWS